MVVIRLRLGVDVTSRPGCDFVVVMLYNLTLSYFSHQSYITCIEFKMPVIWKDLYLIYIYIYNEHCRGILLLTT